ncbi:MAG TPA: hypothetical protein VGW76_17835 [Pyrinomonadaceae bacterium]|nr:hypothetical protein [Pyrinomonadaceae bacterium]
MDQIDPIVSKYESKSAEYLAGVCGAVLAIAVFYLINLKYPLKVGSLELQSGALLMAMLGAALAMLVCRGPSRLMAENRKAKVKTLVDQINLELAAMRTEIDTLEKAQAPAHVLRHAWTDYESALHHCAVVRISAVDNMAQNFSLKNSRT